MGGGCSEYLFKNKNIESWNYYTSKVYDVNRIANENPFPQFLETNN
jgi:hypothetical protein